MAARIGHYHKWGYKTEWHERKVTTRRWVFKTFQTKKRTGKQMSIRQGAPVGSRFHWRINATQHMTKVSPNMYRGGMVGTKKLITSRRGK